MSVRYIFYLSLCFLLCSGKAFSEARMQLKTVKDFDLKSYMGHWYQIATIPTWFQGDCAKDATAHYELKDELVKVTNKCVEADGSLNVGEGMARVNPEFNQSSKMQVTFVSLFGSWLWKIGGDYWVLELLYDKHVSVVGDSQSKYLWILSRSQTLSQQQLVELNEKIMAHHYDTCLIKVTQEGEFNNKNLCEMKAPLGQNPSVPNKK